jgi:8-oxo-dGTP diphosphatase
MADSMSEARMRQGPVLAASIAVFRSGKVLLAQRGRGALAGLWSLPGGHVRFGERLDDAALRELREEVGVEAEIIGFNRFLEVLSPATHTQPAWHYVIASFAGLWQAGEAETSPEARAVGWFNPDQIDGMATTPGLAAVILSAAKLAQETLALPLDGRLRL